MFEDLNETLYQEIQNMIDNNQFLKGKVKADNSTVFEAGDFILLLSDLSHITDAHVDETIPGSKFEKGVDLKKAIIGLVSNNKPTEMTKGFGPSESKVTNPEEAEKFKWLGLDSKTNVGVENVHKLEPNADEFKSMNVYTYKDSRGNEFNIKVKEGEGEKTTFLSFIGAKLGKIGDKSVLSVMTAFPGKNGAEVANRNDFMKQGYYFTTTSKDVIENSKGSVVESFNYKMKYLKFYEDFNEKYTYYFRKLKPKLLANFLLNYMCSILVNIVESLQNTKLAELGTEFVDYVVSVIIQSERDVSKPPPLSLIINKGSTKEDDLVAGDEYYDASDEEPDAEKSFEDLGDASEEDDFSRHDMDIDMSDMDDGDMDGNAYDQ